MGALVGGPGDLRHEGRRLLLPDLPAVDDFLIEDAEFVADAVTVRCQAQGSHGVQEAGWEEYIDYKVVTS